MTDMMTTNDIVLAFIKSNRDYKHSVEDLVKQRDELMETESYLFSSAIEEAFLDKVRWKLATQLSQDLQVTIEESYIALEKLDLGAWLAI